MEHQGFTVWFTGLSGSGKTALALKLEEVLRERGLKTEHLDGDIARKSLTHDLGFSKNDRDMCIERITFVAKLLTRNGVAALCSFISPYCERRAKSRAEIGNFVEVYCKSSLDALVERDVKGLYKKALAGEIQNFTGISDPYEEPENPEVVVETDKETIEESLAKIVRKLEEFGYAPLAAARALGYDTDFIFIILVHPELDFGISKAMTCVYAGLRHGFEKLGVPCHFIHSTRIEHVLPKLNNPVVMAHYDNFHRITEAGRKALSQVRHIIWVNTWYDGAAELAAEYGYPNPVLPKRIQRYILDSGAEFLFRSSLKSYLDYYANWMEHGQRFESLIIEACDTARYYPEPENDKYSHVEMALVNGYFGWKESYHETYLWPYEDILHIWGYNEWPKCYQGYLPIEDERLLYQNAAVCPAIGGPVTATVGHVFERPFKILGSGGLPIVTMKGYREIFSDDELLMPGSVGEYHDMVMLALHDEEFNLHYRATGRKAVLERHTYVHRAKEILGLLGIGE